MIKDGHYEVGLYAIHPLDEKCLEDGINAIRTAPAHDFIKASDGPMPVSYEQYLTETYRARDNKIKNDSRRFFRNCMRIK